MVNFHVLLTLSMLCNAMCQVAACFIKFEGRDGMMLRAMAEGGR